MSFNNSCRTFGVVFWGFLGGGVLRKHGGSGNRAILSDCDKMRQGFTPDYKKYNLKIKDFQLARVILCRNLSQWVLINFGECDHAAIY